MPFDAINYQGKNFAPVKPLQEAKKLSKDQHSRQNPSSINAFFREIWQGLSNENDTAWREIIEQARIISLLRSGKLVLKNDLISGGVVAFKPQNSNNRSNYPLFPQNSEILISKWKKASQSLGVAARHFGDGYKTDIQINQINTVVKSYFKSIFTSEYLDAESCSAQDTGIYITQFEYDDDLNQMIEIAPVIQNQSKVLVDGYGACYDCGKEGHPDDFAQTGAPMPQCPECGSYRTTNMVPDAVADEAVITDLETVSQGDIRGSLRDFAACRYDPKQFPHNSDYFLYSSRVPLRMIHKMFGEDLDISASESEDLGLQLLDALAVRGGSTNEHGENDLNSSFEQFTETGTMRSMWLKPAQYAGFKLEKSENTLAGRIPAGVPFEEIFPDGICVRGFNDMRLQVGLWAEEANIASSPFLYQSHSGHGKGVSDAVDTAKDMNELYSMAMASVKRLGAGGLAIEKGIGLTPAKVRNLFRPEGAVFVDTSTLGYDINKAIKKIDVSPVNAVLPQMMVQQANMLNLAFMTGDFSEGSVQDVDINTLGGQQLAHAKAEEKKGGILTRLVSHREQSAAILWKLFRKHIKRPRYYAHGQDTHGTIKGKWISGADMPDRVFFDAVPDSEIPVNKYEKRVNADAMFTAAGGIDALLMAAQADPRMASWYTGLYGVELPMLNQEEIQLVCLARLAEIKDLSEMFPDPEQILMQLTNKLKVGEDSHILKSQFLQQVLDDDEVQEWNPVAIATLELLVERHLDLQTEFELRAETRQMRAGMKLQAEQMQFQQQMMAPQLEAQAAAEEEQAIAGAAMEVGSKILEDEQKQVDYDREQDAKDDDEARSERAADATHQRQIEMEREKAKLNPKPAPGKAAAAKR